MVMWGEYLEDSKGLHVNMIQGKPSAEDKVSSTTHAFC